MSQPSEHMASGHPVASEIMKTKLITFPPDIDVYKAVEILIKNRISGAPVIDKERRLMGTFSEKSVMKVLVNASYHQIPATTIEGIMHKQPYTIDENTHLVSIAQIFLTTECRRLPVLRDGILLGQVSRRDVVEAALKVVGKPQSSHDNHSSQLLYLSALRSMNEAPGV